MISCLEKTKPPTGPPSARRLILDQIIDQSKYTSKLRLLTGKNNLIQLLRDLKHLQIFTPYQKSIQEYENIDHLLTKSRLHANSKIG